MQGFKIIGHRGWGPTHGEEGIQAASFPENTLLAFDHAMKNGADGIETDILMSKDGVPVVIHDRHLKNHVAPSSLEIVRGREVGDCTFEELKTFDLGCGERIISLDELLGYFAAHYPAALINLDVKDKKAVLPILDSTTSSRLPAQNFIVSSYDWDLLRDFRDAHSTIQLVPAVKTALLFGAENVGENFLPLADKYKHGVEASLFDIKEELDCIAFDCSVTDLKNELIGWAESCRIGLQISTSNRRVNADQTDYALLSKLQEAARTRLPFVVCKVDEPGPVIDRLYRPSSTGNPGLRHFGFC